MKMTKRKQVPGYLTIALTDIAGRRLSIAWLPTIIGRRDADINIEHPSVSARHAVLDVQDGKLILTDSGSRNGTHVNGFPIAKPTVVKTGDEITFGAVPYTLEFTVARPAVTPTGAAVHDPNALTQQLPIAPKVLPLIDQRAVILVVSLHGKQRQYHLDKRITTVGRVDCDINVEDPAMSRRHLQIEVYSNHFAIKDLASANGTFVDGKPVSYYKTPGEEAKFRAGNTTFHLYFNTL